MGINLTQLETAIKAHGHVTRVLIAAHKGSTPRETGTSMLVWQGGQSGTIGGGTLELQATELARKITKPTELKIPLGPALGQCCGGSVTLVLEPFIRLNLPPPDHPYTRRITGSAPQPLSQHAAKANARNAAVLAPFAYENGWLTEAIEPAKTQLWLYGAGHVGRAIVETLNGLPFEVIWVDTAANRFPPDHAPNATPLIAANPADAAAHANADAHHLVLTYSHALDLEICHRVLSQPHGSLGLIGSRTKRARFTSKLAALGHSAAQISRINCPIGHRSLGKTPKAIAIGIAHDLLTMRAVHFSQQEATA